MTVFKSKTPPLCRYCGKAIPRIAEWVYIFVTPPKTETPEMKYGTGENLFKSVPTGKMTKIHVPRHIVADPPPQTVTEAQKLINEKIIAVRRNKLGLTRLSVWDGERYVDPYFCNNDHAVRYAYGVVASEHNRAVFPAYRAGLEKQKARLSKEPGQ